MRENRTASWKLSLCALVLATATWARAEPERGATVAPFAKPPTIDGKIDAGEWDGAVCTMGVQDIQNGFMESRMATTYLGFTPERLYIAMVSEVSPAGAFAVQKNRDSDVIWDDGIEIWLDPNRDTRASGEGDLRYYQFMCNPIGTILDVAFAGKGAPDTGWNAHWECVNTVDDARKLWTAEVSVPFADLGWEQGKTVGRSIGVLIARNFKAGWTQSTWFPHSGAFVSWFAYPRIHLTADAPSVQIQSLGDKLFTGEMHLRARILNPGAARQAQVSVLASSSDMPDVKDEKTIELPAAGTAEYTFDIPEARFHEAAQHKLALVMRSADGAQTLLDYAMKWQKAPEHKWQVEASKPDPEASVKYAYYPSYSFVRVAFDARQLEKEFQEIKSAKVAVTAPDGKAVASGTMTWEKAPQTQEFKLPDLPDGEYTLTVTPEGYGKGFVRKFVRKHFAWEGNTLGITDEVLPPFEPIKVAENRVAVVLREYAVDGLGLWQSVKAAGNVSAGGPRELLAGPMALKVSGVSVQVPGGTDSAGAGNSAQEQALIGKGRFTSIKPQAVVYEGLAEHPAVTIKTRCTTEYDGCMKVELTLLPPPDTRNLKPETLSRLSLDIPLKNDLMPLWHVNTAGLRQNPAGATPAGEGAFWDSRKFPDGNWYGNFKPYIWLGAEERGLCWFADNDRGWELDVDPKDPEKTAPCLVLNRSGDVLTLRVNLIQKPVTITEPRTIVFGLMASPAKPMPNDWRKVSMTEGVTFSMSYLGDNVCSAKTPHGGDFSIMDKMQEARRGVKVDNEAIWKEWSAKHIKPAMDAKLVERFHNMTNLELNWSAQRAPWFSYYFDEYHSTCQTHPEAHVFQCEWSGDWMRPLQTEWLSGEGAGSINVSGLVRSHQDFACWYGAEHIKRGIGLYFDNSFLKRAYDPLTTSAYRLPTGDVQPSAGVWAHREYQKRMWVLHQKLSPSDTKALMIIHMTNTELIPTMVWNTANLDLEWFYGPEPQQSKYADDLLRTESLGRQAGCIPLVIAQVADTKSDEEKERAYRTQFGTMLVHDIRTWHSGLAGRPEGKLVLEFGYAQPDCKVLNYWDEGYPVRVSDPRCKSLLLQRGDDRLLMLVTWNGAAASVALAFDFPVATALDAESKEELPVEGGKLSVAMDGYGVRFVRLN